MVLLPEAETTETIQVTLEEAVQLQADRNRIRDQWVERNLTELQEGDREPLNQRHAGLATFDFIADRVAEDQNVIYCAENGRTRPEPTRRRSDAAKRSSGSNSLYRDIYEALERIEQTISVRHASQPADRSSSVPRFCDGP